MLDVKKCSDGVVLGGVGQPWISRRCGSSTPSPALLPTPLQFTDNPSYRPMYLSTLESVS